MPYKRNYVCGQCDSAYTIKQIEKMGIYCLMPTHEVFWHCDKCDMDNWFFNFEARYMPTIIEINVDTKEIKEIPGYRCL